MTIFKQSIPQLESKLADLRAEHAKTMDAFALSRAKIENVADRIVDGSDRSLFTESLAAAQRDQATARAQLEKLESEISETKFALTAAVERPARKASAAQLNEAATAIEKAWRELIPYLDKLTTALADASYRPLMNSSPNLFLARRWSERERSQTVLRFRPSCGISKRSLTKSQTGNVTSRLVCRWQNNKLRIEKSMRRQTKQFVSTSKPQRRPE